MITTITIQNTQEVENERFLICPQDKTMCECSASVAFNKAANGHTCIDENEDNDDGMTLGRQNEHKIAVKR